MEWTSPKMFDKFPAPTLVLHVVLNTKVSFTGHSRQNTIEFLLIHTRRFARFGTISTI